MAQSTFTLKRAFQSERGQKLLEIVLGNYLYPAILILIVVYGILARDKNYFSYQNIRNLSMSMSVSILAASALFITTLVGQIDASTRGVSGLGSVLLGVLFQLNGWPPIPAIAVILLVAILMGLVTSVMVVEFKVGGLIATLALVSIYIGLAMFFHNNQMIAVNRPQLQDILYHDILGFPFTVWFALGVFGLMWVLLNHTKLGAHMYAVGANRYAALVSGVPVNRVTRITMVLAAMMVAIAGILSTARTGLTLLFGSSGGINWDLGPIVMGGASIFGGVGKIERIGLAILFGAIMANGMNILDVRTGERFLLNGIIFLGALILNVIYLRMRKLL
jgi:ribose transport system permease protein